MGFKQYSVGKSWEEELLKYYSDKKYWVYKIPTLNNGTVFDIIVVKGGSCLCIEAKHTTSDKLYYKSCGIYKKRDELDRFVKKTNNNVYIMIKSDKVGYFWTTWLKAKPIFEEKGYLDLGKDCFKVILNGEI